MVPPFIPTCQSLTQSDQIGQQFSHQKENESQNYIPQSGATSTQIKPNTTLSTTSTTTFLLDPSNGQISFTNSVGSNTVTSSSQEIPNNLTNNNDQESTSNREINFGLLADIVPENVTRAICDILCRPPPKLKPRPPGPLSAQFEEGLPSSAGVITNRINSISHRVSFSNLYFSEYNFLFI